MSLTYTEAADDIFAMFKTAWDTTGYPVHYDNVDKDRQSTDNPWAIALIRHGSGFQATLSGAAGASTFRRRGRLFVEIYTAIGKGFTDFYNLAKVVSDAYEGSASPGGVWFKNTTIVENGQDGKFNRGTVTVEFEYDEIK